MTFFLLTLLTSCKDYYNDTIKWADEIEIGTDIKTIKNNQPEFIEIDWNKPNIVETETRYLITKIKGNPDILSMSHYLVFINNKYQGRDVHK
jgi:hypothetical protein